jgi:hypothetical protein
VFSVCACLGFLIGRGGASGHDRPDASDHCGSLLDSNRTLALWRPVHLACASSRCFAGALLGLTSASGQLRDHASGRASRVRSISTSASGRASRMGGVRTYAFGQFDQHVRSTRLQRFQVPNGSIRRGTSIYTRWSAQGSHPCIL